MDGLAEAIELPDRSFVLGVQWHPEADAESPLLDGLWCEAARLPTRSSACGGTA